MNNKLLTAIAFLLILSAFIILSERRTWKNYESMEIKAFQSYAGGIGLGATINPAWGFISYDPRVDSVDETQLWPIPGGYSYSPDRGVSVSDINEIAFTVN